MQNFCTNSIVQAITRHRFDNYWTQTSAYESLKFYIDINMEGLKDDILAMLSGIKVYVDTKEAFIPNLEIRSVFETTVRNCNWNGVSTALMQSQKLLDATLRKDADTVADVVFIPKKM